MSKSPLKSNPIVNVVPTKSGFNNSDHTRKGKVFERRSHKKREFILQPCQLIVLTQRLEKVSGLVLNPLYSNFSSLLAEFTSQSSAVEILKNVQEALKVQK
ncbi:hypothetical protein MTR_7g021350 [Medicago truncatula]|uniref:Uncharacterized protein n=1 Tax=Medicago truncatula TaxID=3880 RepID=G7KSZ0_MEDTR|nr:hypothetical protein MTR_7g021350 [Medicago truncatula]